MLAAVRRRSRELMTILIAESSPLIADRLTRTLKELPGFKTITHAADITHVMCALRKHRPSVVIVDPHIAGSGGMKLLKNIKRPQRTLVLIVLSNFACSSHRRSCLKAGADHYLDKSTEFDRVAQLIH